MLFARCNSFGIGLATVYLLVHLSNTVPQAQCQLRQVCMAPPDSPTGSIFHPCSLRPLRHHSKILKACLQELSMRAFRCQQDSNVQAKGVGAFQSRFLAQAALQTLAAWKEDLCRVLVPFSPHFVFPPAPFGSLWPGMPCTKRYGPYFTMSVTNRPTRASWIEAEDARGKQKASSQTHLEEDPTLRETVLVCCRACSVHRRNSWTARSAW